MADPVLWHGAKRPRRERRLLLTRQHVLHMAMSLRNKLAAADDMISDWSIPTVQ